MAGTATNIMLTDNSGNARYLSLSFTGDVLNIADANSNKTVHIDMAASVSGTNTGDQIPATIAGFNAAALAAAPAETGTTIKTALGISTLSGSNTGDQTTITGNAGTVTNATLTTALTVNTGTVTLKGNVANTSALTIGAGAVSISGSNTGDQDLSGLVLKTYTVNGHALSGNVSVTLSDVGGEASGTTATHAALTATHGISGAIVGTIDTQSLTNKTFDQLKTSQTVTVAATDLVWGNSIATHKVPIVLNGTTYYILLVDS